MRTYDNGCFYTVMVSEADVARFAASWPCFGNVRSYWFQFHKLTGDLVDTNHEGGETDGSGIVALSEDAMAYGAERLRLADLLAIRKVAS